MQYRDFFEVHFTISTKIAIFTQDKGSVLVMKYKKGTYGLPGGHMEKGEDPDLTLERELMEELGISLDSYERRDFFFRNSKKRSMILAYTAIAPKTFVMNPPHPDKEHGIWMTRPEVESCATLSTAYKAFILAQW